MKKLFLPAIIVTIVMIFSSCNRDDRWMGCVYGKYAYRGPEFYIGCMSRTEFKQYLESPSATGGGFLLDKEIRWKTAKDCSECQE